VIEPDKFPADFIAIAPVFRIAEKPADGEELKLGERRGVFDGLSRSVCWAEVRETKSADAGNISLRFPSTKASESANSFFWPAVAVWCA